MTVTMILKYFMLPISFLILLIILIIFLGNIDYSWKDWRPATCMSTRIGCFCEEIKDGTIKQPVNTWSSLTFTFLGFIIFTQALVDLRKKKPISSNNPMSTKLVYPLIYCISLIVIGLGSAFYHASLSFVGQSFDVLGMYLFVSFYIVYNLSRLYQLKEYTIYILFILINAVLLYFLILHPELRRYIFAIALLTALFLEILLRKKKNIKIKNRYIFYGFFIMLFSFIIWILDTLRIICSPQSFFQLHSIWHIGGAIAAAFLYLYFRSEDSNLDRENN